MSQRLSYEPLLLLFLAARLAERDILDADLGERLPMALLFRIVFTTLVLEDDDLFAESLLHDLGGDVRAFNRRCADVSLVAIDAENDVVEGDFGASIAGHFRNSNSLAGFSAVLLAAGSDDRVTHGICLR